MLLHRDREEAPGVGWRLLGDYSSWGKGACSRELAATAGRVQAARSLRQWELHCKAAALSCSQPNSRVERQQPAQAPCSTALILALFAPLA